jgi:hypothetical protein
MNLDQLLFLNRVGQRPPIPIHIFGVTSLNLWTVGRRGRDRNHV